MGDRKIRTKVIYLLLWIIIVCAGVLIRTGGAGRLWQQIYDGIYETDDSRTYMSANAAEADVYTYMNYWQSKARELCTDESTAGGEAGTETTSEQTAADKTTEAADNETSEKSTSQEENDRKEAAEKEESLQPAEDIEESIATVTAMADINSSYIGMDSDTLFSYCYNSAHSACITSDELNAEKLLGKDMALDMDTGGYKVLIYHTHSSETFADSRDGEAADTIVGVGSRLAKVLTETYGIPVYHDTSGYDMMSGVLDRDIAYDYSREGVQKILAENPSIEVIIDLHRDGVADGVRLVTEIDGKQTAQVMMVNGMSRNNDGTEKEYLPNAYREDNLAASLQMYLVGRANYGDFVRKIYLSTSRYNMDLVPHAMLIEVGAQTNTLEEEMNAMPLLAAMLAKVLLE